MVTVTYDSADLTYDSILSTFDGGSTQFRPEDLRIDLFSTIANGGGGIWNEYTDHVLTEPGVQWSRGRGREDASPEPGQARFTFDNRDGNFSPRNTASTLYGQLVRNMPVRIGMGNPVLGRCVRTTAGGTTITVPSVASDYTAEGVMAVTYAEPAGNTTSPSGYGGGGETDASAFTIRRSYNTDTTLVSATTSAHSVTLTASVACQVAVPNGTLAGTVGVSTGDAGATPSGVTLVAANVGTVHTAACVWGSDPNGRMQPPLFSNQYQPTEIYLIADSGISTGPRMMVWAWEAKAGQAGAVTITGPSDGASGVAIVVSNWTGADRYSPRFCGEISEWPVEWDPSQSAIVTPIVAGGAMRRMGQSASPVSHLVRELGPDVGIRNYWPMEDPEGSTSFVAMTGGTRANVVGVQPVYASDDGVKGSKPLPAFTLGGARANITNYLATSFGAGVVVDIPSTGTATGTNLLMLNLGVPGSNLSTFGIEYTNNTSFAIKGVYNDGTLAYSVSSGDVTSGVGAAFPNGLNGHQILIYLGMKANGTGVDYGISWTNITPGETAVVGGAVVTLPLTTIAGIGTISCGVEADSDAIGTNGIAFGHMFVSTQYALWGSAYKIFAARGFDQADISGTAVLIARGAGFMMNTTLFPAVDTLMSGIVGFDNTLTALADIEEAGQAMLQDAAGFPGVEWRSLPLLESNDPAYTFSFTGDVLTGSTFPVDDDRLRVTEATIHSTGGGTGHASYAALDGRYSLEETTPVYGATNAQYLSEWLVHVGTWDAARWPEVTLEMVRPGAAAFNLPEFSIGDTIALSNLPSYTGPTGVNLIVEGVAEEIVSVGRYTITLYCRLADPYGVLVPERAARWDTIGNDVTVSSTDVYLGM